MATKAELVQNIRDWIAVDNEIRELNKELRMRKAKQQKISQTLMQTMKDNEIDEFDITGGKLMYNKKNLEETIIKEEFVGNFVEILQGQ